MQTAAAALAEGVASAERAAAPDGTLHRRLVWLTVFRLGSISVLLGGTALVSWELGPGATEFAAPLYAAIGVTYAASLAFALLLRLRRAERAIAVAQIALDVGVASAVVATTGLTDSVFVFLFLLAVVNASVVLDTAGAALAVALGLPAYGALVLSLHPAPWTLKRTLFAHGAAFLVTGALAAYLAQQLRRTGERLAESQSDLAAATEIHESIVQSVTSGLLTLDRRGRITFLNRAGEEITGLSLRDVAGQAAEHWFPAFGGPGRDEVWTTTARGQRRLFGYTVFPLKVRDEARGGTAVIFQDLTDLRAMEEQVQRSKRLAELGEVAAGLAHELRNPLASISGCVELLEDAQLPEDDQRILRIVQRETSRLDQLLRRFLEFSRPSPPQRRPVDVALVAAETLDAFGADPAAGGLAIERALAPARVECDVDQLRQVLWNLVTNAAQALHDSGRGSRVRVACEPLPAGGARLTVEDDGPGIPAQDLQRIFTPFFTTKAKGTGLGLAVVQRIVDAHGGSVAVHSPAQGGARFTVRLPGAASAAAADPR
jgi:two-component system, NtrC family, sensor histidine kinase PilS